MSGESVDIYAVNHNVVSLVCIKRNGNRNSEKDLEEGGGSIEGRGGATA